MSDFPKYHAHPGKIVMIGFGCVGQGVLPLLVRHLDMPPEKICILTAEEHTAPIAAEWGASFRCLPISRGNCRSVLVPLLEPGDFLLNLSIDVSSVALMVLARECGALYLDTCIEPWVGGYTDNTVTPTQRSNYGLREEALALRNTRRDGPTAILTHGANPGVVSHLLKQALLNVAADCGLNVAEPTDRAGWANLAQRLDIRAIHIAERDTQVASPRKRAGEFANTWSVGGFIGEGSQPAELGWGTHERHFPADGARHEYGCQAAIYLQRPGASTRVRSWTPTAGPMHGFLITHGESISIADYLTVGPANAPHYRPTVHYAYHPCDDTVLSIHELAGRNWQPQSQTRVFKDDIVSGLDELGVLLMGHPKGAYWFGSRLTIDQARKLAPNNNATSLQVAASIMAAVVWGLKNPGRDVVDPDNLPHDQLLRWCEPYLGELVGAYTDWTPLQNRGLLFPEAIDRDDPWQFKNVRVV
ncbi:MAG: saccharopine dehydrogenase C-terminal domain-containing protein [Rhodocyclaceae bacterium]